MKKPELVFISYPCLSHFQATLEIVKLLINRHDHLSITILHISNISKFSNQTKPLEQAAKLISPRIRFIELPTVDPGLSDSLHLQTTLIESSKPLIKESISKLFPSDQSSNPDAPRLAGFVLDMFCVHMIDVANEFGVPTYVFFTCSAAFLGSLFHFQQWYDRLGVNLAELSDSDADLEIPTLVNKIPVKVLPTVFKTKNWFTHMMNCTKKIRETKGIIVNTFTELESFAINSLSSSDCPPTYTVGPVLTISDKMNNEEYKDIIEWLDGKPQGSVLFLCFGSMGCFGKEQVKEIAFALEQSGKRFLWSLRKPPTNIDSPSDYDDLNEVLPEGFLKRTSAVGKVIGWAPQVAILAHKAVGGFVSHCGWNSTLESIWFGVPIATWPIYAEQQFNAFQLVTDLGLATEIQKDYRIGEGMILSAEEIENGIKKLLEDESVKKRMKEMSEKSRNAVTEGGSSYSALDRFIADIISNMP